MRPGRQDGNLLISRLSAANIGLLAHDAGLELSHAVQVFLIVALVAAPLGRCRLRTRAARTARRSSASRNSASSTRRRSPSRLTFVDWGRCGRHRRCRPLHHLRGLAGGAEALPARARGLGACKTVIGVPSMERQPLSCAFFGRQGVGVKHGWAWAAIHDGLGLGATVPGFARASTRPPATGPGKASIGRRYKGQISIGSALCAYRGATAARK